MERGDLVELARAGTGRGLAAVTRLPGGTSKGVYRLHLDDGTTAVAYLWHPAENYWPDGGDGPEGVDAFEAAVERFAAIGVRTPRVLLLDRGRSRYPADAAVVEDVTGGPLSEVFDRVPRRTLERLGEAVLAMAGTTGPAPERPCEVTVLERAYDDLGEAAKRVERIGAVRDEVDDVLRELVAAVRPRRRHGFVHGELGPEHVLVTAEGEPVVIDVEGASFFDVEWEHAYLSFRFGRHYRWLEVDGLDEARLRFYRLALHLSLVAGPLRLLEGDFPDRDGMLGIVESNMGHVLGALR
ncbi:phosphotransferase family protein [Umezawaea tangerina]|uniref:Phosphotransferase family enzyme n=1 Tax=Umezawaea tangerina TaxID=84725 RepID=A0A2T0SN26_9PSEU|nr:phosphotransferase [Umezawaea tangerina]PRY34796.1 phosphotransferase family enzyme [Umezawaea tangerina]